ncbi:MAG TPA: putative aminohydrolase SsnA [Anaerolineae bacterium]|nr:putative aminohydrolase SsnA [Anaerolineae bacterium]
MLITHGTLITFGEANRIIEDGALLIEGDRIADIGPTAELAARYPHAETLDAQGKLVMPGVICAHTHFYGAFARGMALPGKPPENFPEILEGLWWRLDKALTLEDVRYSTLVCLADAIRHGTTTLIDHHASPNAIDGSLDVIAEAVQEAGLRACLCYEVTDRDGPERASAGIAENVRFAKSQIVTRKSQLAATFGLHASLTLSDETLERCVAAARPLGLGFHIHVAEDMADQRDSLKKSGLRVVERLEKLGILGERTIAVHCVHLDAYEMDLLRETGTKVTHQPRSNMNNAVGVADVLGMMRRRICVGLGNDGFSNNMFAEMKTAYLVHKLARQDPRVMGADQVLEMAVANNAKIANLFFPGPIGELSVGAYADVILLDYVPPTPLTADNLPWHIIFGVDGSHVTHTICAGRVLMRDRQLTTLDEEAIGARARELARRVWIRI